jgi:hypothetical protein
VKNQNNRAGGLMGWCRVCGVGVSDCKAVPADESSSMTSTQTALGSHKGLSRGMRNVELCSRPLARPVQSCPPTSQDHSRLSASLRVCDAWLRGVRVESSGAR